MSAASLSATCSESALPLTATTTGTGTGTQTNENENETEDQQQENENDVEAGKEEAEDMAAQSTIDKYSNELNEALLSSDVAGVRRLCMNEAVRTYTPYHLTQLEQVLSGSSLTGEAQLQCWHALSQAWPASVESNLGSLIREAVTGGPLEALQELIQKRKEGSSSQAAFQAWLRMEEDYVKGDQRKALFQAEKNKSW